MTSTHQPEHESMLERVVCGEQSPDSPEVLERIASCEECAEALAEMAQLRGQLDYFGVEERALIEEANQSKKAGDDAIVLQELSKAWNAEEGSASRPRWFRPLVLAAASLLLLLGGWRMFGHSGEEATDPQLQQWLGEADGEFLDPIGYLEGQTRAQGFAEFTWDVPTTPGGTFTLRVWNLDESEPVIVKERLRTLSWQPEPDDLERLDLRIRWQVDQFEINGGTIRSLEGRAAVSSR